MESCSSVSCRNKDFLQIWCSRRNKNKWIPLRHLIRQDKNSLVDGPRFITFSATQDLLDGHRGHLNTLRPVLSPQLEQTQVLGWSTGPGAGLFSCRQFFFLNKRQATSQGCSLVLVPPHPQHLSGRRPPHQTHRAATLVTQTDWWFLMFFLIFSSDNSRQASQCFRQTGSKCVSSSTRAVL